ncbi:GntR family transcriptional regulator [Actinokineospora pegani]|uniref:GntR family transcriptional regulator n=1 Tax=Actinokineospora pegani TaxID=2654637 RepID=UPI0022A7139C|nr:GntR family transcriptional regulator [Actinokineospora pegani]
MADDLRARIASGELAPGTKVPGENELVAEYGVAHLTARRGLEVLKNEGLIVARRGSGTFVREFKPIRRIAPDRLRAWTSRESIWSFDEQERKVEVRDLTVGVEPAPERIAHGLVLDHPADVLVRRRSYAIDNNKIQLSTSYFPVDLVRGTAVEQHDPGPGGVYSRLADLGHGPVRFREELRSRMPSAAEKADLELAQGTAVTAIVRTAYTADNRPVEVNEMVLDAGSYVLEYRLTTG